MHFKFSIIGQKKGDLLIQVTAWAGLAVHLYFRNLCLFFFHFLYSGRCYKNAKQQEPDVPWGDKMHSIQLVDIPATPDKKRGLDYCLEKRLSQYNQSVRDSLQFSPLIKITELVIMLFNIIFTEHYSKGVLLACSLMQLTNKKKGGLIFVKRNDFHCTTRLSEIVYSSLP